MINNNNNNNNEVPIKSKKQRLIAIGLILLISLLGFLISFILIKTKPKTKTKMIKKKKIFVKIIQAKKTNEIVLIKSYGQIIPAKKINLMPEVSGKIVYINKLFIPGNILEKDSTIAKIDDRDYSLIVLQKENIVTKLEADFKIEEGKQNIAKKEWQLIQKLSSKKASQIEQDLSLRKPYLKQVNANIKIAKADLEKARLNLSRTEIKIPFNAIIKNKNINIGSQVNTQTTISEIIGIDSYWIKLKVPIDRLKWMDIKNSKVKLQCKNNSLKIFFMKALF